MKIGLWPPFCFGALLVFSATPLFRSGCDPFSSRPWLSCKVPSALCPIVHGSGKLCFGVAFCSCGGGGGGASARSSILYNPSSIGASFRAPENDMKLNWFSVSVCNGNRKASFVRTSNPTSSISASQLYSFLYLLTIYFSPH